jgi:hypothetical protein
MFQEPKGIPLKREVDHEIKLMLQSPLSNIGLYRQSVMEANEVKKELQYFLDQGVIQPSTSPCGTPINIVPKKDGTWNICIDYKALRINTLYPRSMIC